MYFSGLFKKKISIKKGEELLIRYCELNGFDDTTSLWKKTEHSKKWFAYRKQPNKIISNNWVSCHPIRGDNKYSVWIDLVTQDIREILR